jgi:hypothetical protein
MTRRFGHHGSEIDDLQDWKLWANSYVRQADKSMSDSDRSAPYSVSRGLDHGSRGITLRMTTHEVRLKIAKPIEIQRTDIELEVSSNNAKLGSLKISKGSVDWIPSNNSINYYELTWEQLAQIMEDNGRRKRLDD